MNTKNRITMRGISKDTPNPIRKPERLWRKNPREIILQSCFELKRISLFQELYFVTNLRSQKATRSLPHHKVRFCLCQSH